MPELPEVELMCRNMARWTESKKMIEIHGIKNGEELLHTEIQRCFRRGKYCVVPIGNRYWVIHFRMTGKLVRLEGERRFLRVRIVLDDGMELGILDQRRFATYDIISHKELEHKFSKLGDEVWPTHHSEQWFQDRLRHSKASLKSLLLRQDIVAGVGNIMASEICFRMRCDPRTRGQDIQLKQWKSINDAIHDYVNAVLLEEEGDEITFVHEGKKMLLPQSFMVYGRSGLPCVVCSTPIVHWKMNGRATYSCPRCQPIKI
jgi:formamidopyrimidine-DNA glycosylase